MQQQAYMLVFQGELVEGFDLEQAKQEIRELFKVSHDKIEQLFSLPAVVVKKDVSHEIARRFQEQLEQRGLITVIHPMDGSKVVQVAEEASEAGASSGADEGAVEAGAKSSTQNGSRIVPFHFEGRGGEYFKIWIVNVLLSILTLGIYSAWAKVRNHRYFYSNTHLGEHSFEYLANPVTILKGRIIAAVVLAVYILAGEFMPLLNLVFAPLFLVALPWLVIRSMAFRNRNTAFRNIRFGFNATYWEAFKVYVLWGVASLLSLGILIPYAIYRQKRFIVSHSRYGTTAFVPEFTAREFYGIYLRVLGVIIGAVVLMLVPIVGMLVMILALPLYLATFAYLIAATTNLTYNQSSLAEHGFVSKLEVGRLAWIYFSNAVVTALTLGLATPWAKVRLASYHAECLTLVAEGDLDSFIAAEEKNVGSLGEELGDAFDMDIGL